MAPSLGTLKKISEASDVGLNRFFVPEYDVEGLLGESPKCERSRLETAVLNFRECVRSLSRADASRHYAGRFIRTNLLSFVVISLLGTAFLLQIAGCSWPTNDAEKLRSLQQQQVVLLEQLLGRAVVTSTDPMDGTNTYFLMVPASKGEGKLFIRCSGAKELEVFVDVEDMLDTDGYRQTAVRYRTDNGVPLRELWRESKNYKGALSPSPRALVARLEHANTFMFEYSPFAGGTTIISFELADLHIGLPKLYAACHLKLTVQRDH